MKILIEVTPFFYRYNGFILATLTFILFFLIFRFLGSSHPAFFYFSFTITYRLSYIVSDFYFRLFHIFFLFILSIVFLVFSFWNLLFSPLPPPTSTKVFFFCFLFIYFYISFFLFISSKCLKHSVFHVKMEWDKRIGVLDTYSSTYIHKWDDTFFFTGSGMPQGYINMKRNNELIKKKLFSFIDT